MVYSIHSSRSHNSLDFLLSFASGVTLLEFGVLVAKDDLIMLEGKVSDLSGGGMYFISLPNGIAIKAKLCGKMKRFNIKVVVGDRVTVSVSPYDPTHGLITHRFKI